jgi:hypothetical protein
VASVIVHEEWHLRHGRDERGAYVAQLTALAMLGAPSPLITDVRRSMTVAVERQRQRADSERAGELLDAVIEDRRRHDTGCNTPLRQSTDYGGQADDDRDGYAGTGRGLLGDASCGGSARERFMERRR